MLTFHFERIHSFGHVNFGGCILLTLYSWDVSRKLEKEPPQKNPWTSLFSKPIHDESESLAEKKQTNNQVVASYILYFHPYLGKWSILTNDSWLMIFAMGWFNHQLEKHVLPGNWYVCLNGFNERHQTWPAKVLDADGEGELSVSEFTRGRDDRGVFMLLGGFFPVFLSGSDSAIWQTFNLFRGLRV